MSNPTQMRLGYVLSTSFDSLIPWKADYRLDGLEGTMEPYAAEKSSSEIKEVLLDKLRYFKISRIIFDFLAIRTTYKSQVNRSCRLLRWTKMFENSS